MPPRAILLLGRHLGPPPVGDLWMTYTGVVLGGQAIRHSPSAGPRGTDRPRSAAPHRAAGSGAQILELTPGGHLLGEEGGLYAVEQALQPPDELGLGHPQLALGGHLVRTERRGHPGQLGLQVRRQALGQFGDRSVVDLPQPGPRRLVEGCLAHLFEELLDHGADAHDLGRPLHGLVLTVGAVSVGAGRRRWLHDHQVGRGRSFGSHAPSLPTIGRWRRPWPRPPELRQPELRRPRAASSGTSISSAVAEPCRHTRCTSPSPASR